jgi:hypothetical protein
MALIREQVTVYTKGVCCTVPVGGPGREPNRYGLIGMATVSSWRLGRPTDKHCVTGKSPQAGMAEATQHGVKC